MPTMKKIFLTLILILCLFFTHGQKKDTPDGISPSTVKPDYFWNNERNAKAFKTKSNTLIDSIQNGYYAKKEYLTFLDKKLVSIKYDNGGGLIEIKLPGGTGFLTTPKDTIRLEKGKLNGETYFNDYYLLPPYPSRPVISRDLQRSVLTFKDNFLISQLVYRKGILIYESYFKKYDYIKENRDGNVNHGPFQDSILNVYNSNGTIRYSNKIKKGRYIK